MRLRNIPRADGVIDAHHTVIKKPEEQKGNWNHVFGNEKPIQIEIGMGKGQFILNMAKAHPEINFIGIERYSSVLLRALEKYDTEEFEMLENIRFICMDAREIENVFAPAEVDKIFLNFSDPWPKARHAKRRLTSTEFLARYEKVLVESGRVEFKTDNTELFNFSLEQVKEAGWALIAYTYDLHHQEEMNEGNIMTEYEQKFTEKGEIRVTFRQLQKENGKVSLMFRVHDTGKGMDAKFISRIFKPFEQESQDITKQYGGSGLGMSITDRLVHLMGGEIVIDSMLGKGSDFSIYLTLPIAEVSEIETEQEDETGTDFTFNGCHILMAEDNEINAEIAVSILENEGAKVDVAVNGKDAVEKYAASAPGTYNFILMDIQMPVMNGRDAAKQIRSMDRKDAGEIPIFALSADAFVEDQRLSAMSGMNGHFTKPIDFEEMRVQIGKILKGRRKN